MKCRPALHGPLQDQEELLDPEDEAAGAALQIEDAEAEEAKGGIANARITAQRSTQIRRIKVN